MSLTSQPIKENSFTIAIKKGAELQLIRAEGKLTMGSGTSHQVRLTDPTISVFHAAIEKTENGFLIRDQKTFSGTYVNGVRVLEAYLKSGDVIQIGSTRLIFDPTEPIAEVPVEIQQSKNPNFQAQLNQLPSFAASNYPILLLGESGTGKEVLAQTIHQLSKRSSGPMICINCSAISESLIESELFGHTKGSFTGAVADRKGAFELAREGTLFLDEIGDLPLSLQPKLLRAIENGEIWPVGSERCIKTNVRIIAATHPNLINKIAARQFREDLYYRLNTLSLHLPNLRNRLEDFEGLLFHFAKIMKVRFSFFAIEKLKEYHWPGNIRQLRNVVARAAIQYPGQLIEPEQVQNLLLQEPDLTPQAPDSTAKAFFNSGQNLIKEFEREMIISRLTANRGNQRRTAMDLGIPKSTLHDRIYAYGIDPKSFKK